MYLALVRPHVGYAVQFYSSDYKEIGLLVAIGRRIAERIQGMRDNLYDMRLKVKFIFL